MRPPEDAVDQPDEAARTLAPLTSRAAAYLDGEAPAAIEREGIARFERAVRRPRRAALVLGPVLAAALATLALWAWPHRAPQVERTAQPAPTVVAFETHASVDHGVRVVELRFSDGSRVSHDEGARVDVRAVTADGARLGVEGSAKVSVRHRSTTAYAFEAGPYEVRVTGTTFTVAWAPKEERFLLSMDEGRVLARGPELPSAGLEVTGGQRLTASPRERSFHLEAAPGVAPAPVPLPAEVAEASPAPRSERHVRSDWSARVASGDFKGVLAAVRARGVDRCARTCGLTDLVAAADAARYGGARGIARTLLEAERRRFGDTAHGREAPFLLGRLAEDEGRGAEALRWYDRYVAEQPSGTFAMDALARKLDLLQRRGDLGGARATAELYLARFPSGPHAAKARELSPR